MSKIPPKTYIKTSLSKSLFISGIQCHKLLWYKKYQKEIFDFVDSHTQMIFDNGNKVGELACELFAGGKKVEFERDDFAKMLDQTKSWIEQGDKIIYEATFVYDDLLVMVDILYLGEDGWEIYEVKSSTGVKEVYLQDVAVQKYVLEGLGYEVSKCSVVYVNKEYILQDELNVSEYFIIEDVTEYDLRVDVKAKLKEFKSILDNPSNPPKTKLGSHCNKPYSCPAKEWCWEKDFGVDGFNVFDIFGLRANSKALKLYDEGIIKVKDIPDDFKLTKNQAITINSYKNDKSIINEKEIRAFVSKLTYPIYHLDFETFQEAIPTIKGTSPYQQIPFQYSLHIEYEDGKLDHLEFLADEGKDPREDLVKSLINDIPKDATILAYNASFEKGVLKKLANSFPMHEEHLNHLLNSIIDLAEPFQKKHYYLPQMRGKYSIKIILPLLAPDMQKAYEELPLIHNGSDAMSIYPMLKTMPKERKEEYRDALLKYCKLDTLAMVRVLEKLREV
jgi:hypothetical protein